MLEIITVGLDLAKNVFQVHGADGGGQTGSQFRRNAALDFGQQQGAACFASLTQQEHHAAPGHRNGYLIPTCTDQHSCAHWRRPMDLIRAGWPISLFQASQQ